MIKACREEGKTLKVIAGMYSCSTSTIHKIVKLQIKFELLDI